MWLWFVLLLVAALVVSALVATLLWRARARAQQQRDDDGRDAPAAGRHVAVAAARSRSPSVVQARGRAAAQGRARRRFSLRRSLVSAGRTRRGWKDDAGRRGASCGAARVGRRSGRQQRDVALLRRRRGHRCGRRARASCQPRACGRLARVAAPVEAPPPEAPDRRRRAGGARLTAAGRGLEVARDRCGGGDPRAAGPRAERSGIRAAGLPRHHPRRSPAWLLGVRRGAPRQPAPGHARLVEPALHRHRVPGRLDRQELRGSSPGHRPRAGRAVRVEPSARPRLGAVPVLGRVVAAAQSAPRPARRNLPSQRLSSGVAVSWLLSERADPDSPSDAGGRPPGDLVDRRLLPARRARPEGVSRARSGGAVDRRHRRAQPRQHGGPGRGGGAVRHAGDGHSPGHLEAPPGASRDRTPS